MNRRPSLQFYPADWLKDPDLQMCSMNTIGIWINLLCRMWEAKEEGILTGTVTELSLLVGARPREFKKFLEEAVAHKFCDVSRNVTKCHKEVTVMCRRMNKVFKKREGAKFRKQRQRGRSVTPDVTTPSSSSSSSSVTYTQKDCIDIGFLIGFTEEQSLVFFHHYNKKGWVDGNRVPLTNLRSAMVSWRNNQHKYEAKKNGSTRTKNAGSQTHSTAVKRNSKRCDETYIR